MSTMFISKETARIVGFTPEEIKLVLRNTAKNLNISVHTQGYGQT